MKMLFTICRALFLCIAAVLFLVACKKGEFIPVDRYMKFRVDAFYTDTSLFQSISLDEETLAEDAVLNPGTATNLVNITAGIKRKDSSRMRILIVKKKNPNIEFDSVVYLTNVNDFLLLQLNPLQKPVLINKQIENIAAVQPGKDSVKLRFYFNQDDNLVNPKNSNSKITVANLQLYTGETDNSSGQFIVKPERLITGVRLNQLGEYVSFSSLKYYAFTLLDASPNVAANRREVQVYKQDGISFVRGNISFAPPAEGKFQSIRLRTSVIVDINGIDQKGYNGIFLFGLN